MPEITSRDNLATAIKRMSALGEGEFSDETSSLLRSLAQHTPELSQRIETLEDARFWVNLPWKQNIIPILIASAIASALSIAGTLIFS